MKISEYFTMNTGDIHPSRVESSMATAIRLVQYPDGERRFQGGYHWNQGFSSGFMWKDLPIVFVDSKGQEFDCD